MTYDRVVRTDTRLFNSGRSVSDWVETTAGAFLLDQNKTNGILMIPLSNIPVGKKISAFRVIGGIGATTGEASTLDASLQKVTGTDGGITDSAVTGASITQVSTEADDTLDEEAIPTDNTFVEEDAQYYIKIDGTTADDAACDIFVTGIELDLN